MDNKNNMVCAICGRGYEACLSCNDELKAQPWKQHTDTSEHYKLYQLIYNYKTVELLSKEEAIKALGNIDTSDKDEYRPHIKVIVEELLLAKEELNRAVAPMKTSTFKTTSVKK